MTCIFMFLQRIHLMTLIAGIYGVLMGQVHAQPQGNPKVSLEEAAQLYAKAEKLYAQGLYAEAIPLVERVLGLRQTALGLEHRDVGDALRLLGELNRKLGKVIDAEGLLQRALSIYEKTLGPDHIDVAAALHSLAGMRKEQGEFNRAESLFLRSLRIREAALGSDDPQVALAHHDLGVLYLAQGDRTRAEASLLRGKEIWEKAYGVDHPNVASSLHALATLYKDQKEYDKAEPLFLRALKIHETVLGPQHPRVAPALNNLAIVYTERGEYSKAEALYQRSLKIFEATVGSNHMNVAATLNNLALLAHSQGEYVKAESLYQRSLSTLEAVMGPDHPHYTGSLHNLALTYWADGRTNQAIQSFEQAQEVREEYISLLIKTSNEAGMRSYLATVVGDIDAIITFLGYTDDSRVRRLAFTTLLRRKGRVLDSMSQQLATLRSNSAVEIQSRLEEWQALRSEQALLLMRGPGKLTISEHLKTLDAVERRAQAIEEEMIAANAEFRIQRQRVTTETVQSALPVGSALVEWVRYRKVEPKARTRSERYGSPRYAAVVLFPSGEPTWLDLGDAELIEAQVASLRMTLARGLVGASDEARRLDAMVMAPIRMKLGSTRHVFLSPDGDLNLLPFAALVDEQGRYLVESYTFTYLTGGRDLLRLALDTKAQSPALIVAAPHYGRAGAGDPFDTLQGVVEEAELLRNLFPDAFVLTGDAATEARIKQNRGPAIIHIATHGFFGRTDCEGKALKTGDPMLKAGLALAGANGCQSPDNPNDDGILTAHEVTALDLRGTELAVLSACDTGVGPSEITESPAHVTGRADGVYGLRRALSLAGAETQVMSLWKVADYATRDFMAAYYRRLTEGWGRSEALRQVQLALLRDPETRLPYFWSSFIAAGNPAPLDAFREAKRDTAMVEYPGRVHRRGGCACDSRPSAAGSAWLLVIPALLWVGSRSRRFAREHAPMNSLRPRAGGQRSSGSTPRPGAHA